MRSVREFFVFAPEMICSALLAEHDVRHGAASDRSGKAGTARRRAARPEIVPLRWTPMMLSHEVFPDAQDIPPLATLTCCAGRGPWLAPPTLRAGVPATDGRPGPRRPRRAGSGQRFRAVRPGDPELDGRSRSPGRPARSKPAAADPALPPVGMRRSPRWRRPHARAGPATGILLSHSSMMSASGYRTTSPFRYPGRLCSKGNGFKQPGSTASVAHHRFPTSPAHRWHDRLTGSLKSAVIAVLGVVAAM